MYFTKITFVRIIQSGHVYDREIRNQSKHVLGYVCVQSYTRLGYNNFRTKYTCLGLYILKALLLKKAGKVTGFFGLRNPKTLII